MACVLVIYILILTSWSYLLVCHLGQLYLNSAYATLTACCPLNNTVHLVLWHMFLPPSMPLSLSFLHENKLSRVGSGIRLLDFKSQLNQLLPILLGQII